MLKAYCDEMRGIWADKTRVMNEGCYALFRRQFGDPPFTSIGRAELRDFKDVMRRLPPNSTKRFPKLIIEAVLARKMKPGSPRTVNENLAALSTFFGWAQRHGYCSDNPASGLGIRVLTLPRDERDAYGPQDLNRLFLSPLFTGCKGRQNRDLPGRRIIRDEKYGIPLIALYTGMRLEEICELRASDIIESEGLKCIRIHREAGNSLKTPKAARTIPIHPWLLELGLPAHIAGLGTAATGTLWPGTRRGSDGKLGARFSKWFGRYMDRIGITNRKLTFHSLRHTFVNELKQKSEEPAKIRAYVGHAEPSVTLGRYGKAYRPGGLAELLPALVWEYGQCQGQDATPGRKK